MNIQQIIKQHHLELLFQQGSFGIEKESQRVHVRWFNSDIIAPQSLW